MTGIMQRAVPEESATDELAAIIMEKTAGWFATPGSRAASTVSTMTRRENGALER